MTKKVNLEDIVSLCKRRGFIYQGSEIYGGLAGTWDYGPLGSVLRRNIVNEWLKFFVDGWDDMYQVDTAILMNPKVWQASGHVDTFHDPLCEDEVNHKTYRTDHILKDNGINADDLSLEQMDALIEEKKIKSPDGNPLTKSTKFNMMFKTVVGPKFYSIEPKKDEYVAIDKIQFKNRTDDELGLLVKINDPFKELTAFNLYNKNSLSYLRPETAQGMFTN
jgi:glycyl-tRNA synthetase (class II)